MPTDLLRSVKTDLRETKTTLSKIKTLSRFLYLEKDLVSDLENTGQALLQAQERLQNTDSIANLTSFILAVRQIKIMTSDLLIACKNKIKCSA
jgi:hypothetical protein